MKSRAALLREFGKGLRLETVEIPSPKGEEVLIRVEGAGVCRTDLRIISGVEAKPGFKLPIILGHENAGRVVEVGENVRGLKPGDRVLVYSTWGDLTCRYCRRGLYSLCPNQIIPGQNTNGGYSEYMLVESYRWVERIGDLDPVEAAPLADAGTTSMGALRLASPYVEVGKPMVIYGVGGLAVYAIQLARLLFRESPVIAVSRNRKRRELALNLGAEEAVDPNELEEAVKRSTGGEGIPVAIDLVGTEETTMRLSKVLAVDGAVILVGIEGRTISAPTFDLVVWNKKIIGSNYGTMNDMADVIKLIQQGKVKSMVVKRNLEEINQAMADLREGRVEAGRQVIVP